MIIKSKTADFSNVGLGVLTDSYEVETLNLIANAGYSNDKAAKIDLFFKAVKPFKSKLQNSFLFATDFEQSKYNLFDNSKLLSKVGNPSITDAGLQATSGNYIDSNVSLSNSGGFIFGYQNNTITEGGDGVLAGADASGVNKIFYVSKDLLSLGTRGTFAVHALQTNATKYLGKGSVYFGAADSEVTLFIDGNEIEIGAISSDNAISTQSITIGSMGASNIYSAKIGFVCISTVRLTNSEIMTLHNAVESLIVSL